MPTNTAPDTAPNTDTAANADTAPNADIAPLCRAELRREKGKLVLALDLAPLHSYLDSLGVKRTDYRCTYDDAPSNGSSTINTSTHQISPALLCSWTPDEDGGYRPFRELEIASVYTSRPPTAATISTILDSLWDAANAVTEHYRPITISVTVHASVARDVKLASLVGPRRAPETSA